ncbi:MAG: DNA polymerase IV [Bacillota bacterium]|nr:DNA polymerase IV [Bacillota bacterium]
MDRWILLCDLDAFFAAVEVLDQPHLKGKPVIVGGMGPRGVVATCSYEARAAGVHSAMSTAKARELCPQGVFLPPRPQRYREKSQEVFAIFRRFALMIEPRSIDEAYLEVDGDGPEMAKAIQEAVVRETGLSLAIGGGANKVVAKIASQLAKPGGIFWIPQEKAAEILAPLPAGMLPGVGPKTEALLRKEGYATIGDLQKASRERLQALLGERAGQSLWEKAAGQGPEFLDAPVPPKSVSVEETFPFDIPYSQVPSELRKLSRQLAKRLQGRRVKGHTLALKIRFPSFQTLTRQTASPQGLQDEEEIFSLARRLFEIHMVRGQYPRRVRLLGLRVNQLKKDEGKGRQLTFFPLLRPDDPFAGALPEESRGEGFPP